MSHKNKKKLVKCKMCGECCTVLGADGWIDCKYLIRYLPSESKTQPKTRCMVYHHRLYAIIGKKQYCTWRNNIPFNFLGCPFNRKEWSLHPKYLKDYDKIIGT